jgi:hypothetical protein
MAAGSTHRLFITVFFVTPFAFVLGIHTRWWDRRRRVETIPETSSSDQRKDLRQFLWALTVITFLLCLSGFSLSVPSLILAELSISFHRRVDILAPKIGPEEVVRLRGRWAAMNSRADYQLIRKEMDDRASALAVELPPAPE